MRLQNTITELGNEKKRQQILDMAHLKLLIVKDFMPDETFNDTYKEYLNNTPEKLALVGEILGLTGMYSKKYLQNIPLEELETMKEKLLPIKNKMSATKKLTCIMSKCLMKQCMAPMSKNFQMYAQKFV